MKQTDLKPCAQCGKGVMHSGFPIFWRVTAERFAVDLAAVRRQAGLEMLIGNPEIAFHMGEQANIAKPLMDKVTFLLCESCALESHSAVGFLALSQAEDDQPEP